MGLEVKKGNDVKDLIIIGVIVAAIMIWGFKRLGEAYALCLETGRSADDCYDLLR